LTAGKTAKEQTMKKKHGAFFGFAVLLVTAIFALAGCGDNGDPTSPPGGDPQGDGPFTVKFTANGGITAPLDQTINKGENAVEPPLMTNPNHEDFTGWFTNAACTDPFDFNTAITANITLYAKWGYFIGDTDPAGGKIFYVKSGATHPNWKYLEVAPVAGEQSLQYWAKGGYDTNKSVVDFAIVNAKGTAIGTGKDNTAAIIAVVIPSPVSTDPPDFPVAKYCDAYTGGGKSDWFLPSKDELNELYKNRVAAGCNTSAERKFYWSSSQDEGGVNRAWAQNFGTSDPGQQTEENKQSTRAGDDTDPYPYARPIRSFFCNH
jgi:uncharacterized repeat protein (TIGR02543 family)